jgi:hypothetical protein
MSKKGKATSDAIEILYRRYYEGKPNRLAALDEARAEDKLARDLTGHFKTSQSGSNRNELRLFATLGPRV